GADVVRAAYFGLVSPHSGLCRQDPPRREARRPSSRAADQIRVRHQSHRRQGARPGRAGHVTRPCRRGDRMKRREFITLLGSAAVALPLAARAQQPRMPVIGFLSSRSAEDTGHLVEVFRRGLKDGGGGVEGANFIIEYRWARGDYSRLPAFATDLASRQVDVIAAFGGDPSALAAKRATSTIPIVATLPGDPISPGLVQSFNRPGGNVTGLALASDEIEPKRLGLLRELAPSAALFGGLVNPNFPPAAHQLRQLEEAARVIS